MLLPENGGNEQNKWKWHYFSGNAYDTNSNNWKRGEGAERDILQCISYVFQLEHKHLA